MVSGVTGVVQSAEGGLSGGRPAPNVALAEGEGGYACGLWSLLHVLSVGAAERHTAVLGDADRVSVRRAGTVQLFI